MDNGVSWKGFQGVSFHNPLHVSQPSSLSTTGPLHQGKLLDKYSSSVLLASNISRDFQAQLPQILSYQLVLIVTIKPPVPISLYPCFLSPFSCLLSLVSRLLSHVSCLMPSVSRLTSHVSRAVSVADSLDLAVLWSEFVELGNLAVFTLLADWADWNTFF